MVKANQLYQHFKGNFYKVLCVAQHSEDGSALVIYTRTSEEDKTIYARPIEMFTDTVKRDNYEGPRFIFKGWCDK